jgi:glycosyltransferase involved in cell wall biosynthesis
MLFLDLQACQSESKFRGIGRYSLSLAIELVEIAHKKNHLISILLNDNFSEDCERLRDLLKQKFPYIKVVSLKIPTPSASGIPENQWRLRASEILREFLLLKLAPDYIHVSTLIADGWGDDCVASVGELNFHIPTALTHYDMIPLVLEKEYMPPGFFRDHYLRRLESVKRADLLLAISDYSRIEALEWLNRKEDSVVSISAAVDEDFNQVTLNSESVLNLYNLKKGFLLYAPGGFDPRKNIDRLIQAYAGLEQSVKINHPLVIASKLHPGIKDHWLNFANQLGLAEGQIIFTDYVPDDHLKVLYSACHAYVLPSLHEGFGLPVLEAMLCGAPVIGANATSIPEAIGLEAALFDPYSVEDIQDKLNLICTNQDYLDLLKAHSKVHPKNFSWKRSAELAINAIEKDYLRLKESGYKPLTKDHLPTYDDLVRILDREFNGVGPTESDWIQFKECFDTNLSQFNK